MSMVSRRTIKASAETCKPKRTETIIPAAGSHCGRHLQPRLSAVRVVRAAIVAIAYTVAIAIAVAPVHDAIAVKITVRAVHACLAPLIARATGVVDLGDAAPEVVAVIPTALPVLHLMASTIALVSIVVGRGVVGGPGLHIHRRRLNIDAWHLHANGEGHIAAGMRRRSRCESAKHEYSGRE